MASPAPDQLGKVAAPTDAEMKPASDPVEGQDTKQPSQEKVEQEVEVGAQRRKRGCGAFLGKCCGDLGNCCGDFDGASCGANCFGKRFMVSISCCHWVVHTPQFIANLRDHGPRLIRRQIAMMLFWFGLSGLCWRAWWVSSRACHTHPVVLRNWFWHAAVMQSMIFWILTWMLFTMRRIMDGMSARVVAEETVAQDEAANEAPPEPAGEDAGAATDEDLTKTPGAIGLMVASTFLALLSSLTMIWLFFGFFSAVDAGDELNEEDCECERVYFWIIFITLLVLNLLCQCVHQADARR